MTPKTMNTLRHVLQLFALGLVLCFTTTAFADCPKVFLNQVDITGVSSQTFENATIKIDNQGNIIIEAPQYKVEVQGDSGTPEAPTTVLGEYFLIINNSSPGKVQYELDVYVNGVLLRTVRDKQAQVVVDITDKLINGVNTMTINAKKQTGVSRQSVASTDAIELLVGKGSSAGNQLTVERQFVTFRVDASQTEDLTQNYTFEVK